MLKEPIANTTDPAPKAEEPFDPESEQDRLIEKSCKLLAFKIGNLIEICDWGNLDLEMLGIRQSETVLQSGKPLED